MKAPRSLSLIAVIGLAHWFFGNVYEEIVLAPNNLVHSYAQLTCWQAYFSVTNQIYYYVPFTQMSVLVVWYLYARQKEGMIRKLLRKASLYGFFALALTVGIVTQLNMKLFFGDLNQYRDELHTLSLIWLLLNGLRIGLVGATLFYAFQSYRQFDRQNSAFAPR